MLTTSKLDRLKARILNAMKIAGHSEFASRNLAATLATDKYDVLHALHALRHDGAVEQIQRCDDVMIDRWKLAHPVSSYSCKPTEFHCVAEAL